MQRAQPPTHAPPPATGPSVAAPPIDERISQLSELVESIGERPAVPAVEPPNSQFESRLAEVRLGVAASLFTALRSKHAPTASHSLRVALQCSAWALAIGLADEDCDVVEAAALLHDVGKIGVPDSVLQKPGALTPDEAALMDRQRALGLEILGACCARSAVLETVRHAPAWYDGTRPQGLARGADIPLGARMIAIADAYDSMTSDQIYRRALSHERAVAELYRWSGTQFDPQLVQHFEQRDGNAVVQQRVAKRWLHALSPEAVDSRWKFQGATAASGSSPLEELFQQKLLDNMYDAIVFVDRSLRIMLWNPGAERLTGISGQSVFQSTWAPGLVDMCDQRSHRLSDVECPVTQAIQTGIQSYRRLDIAGRGGKRVTVDVQSVPVVSRDGTTHGATVVLHDASPEASLEQRCQRLQDRASKDPLTQVANRAEFDRTHELFVSVHLEQRLPCSLIMCDIDHFKQINDQYGHQAGDEALKSFAQLLKGCCRPGDLVARYGGEEFVMLCADCGNATAAHRAEQVRRAISDLPQPSLGGRNITVSFGVTEIQSGDTPTTMLARADRALLDAKQLGRNTVVQLGTGVAQADEQPGKKWSWFGGTATTPGMLVERWLSTTVPLKVAVEKLRGFVADQQATITSIEGDTVHLKIDSERTALPRRSGDRPVALLVELRLTPDEPAQDATHAARASRTRIHVIIRPRRDRDRRKLNALERARHIMASLKSYLMASEDEAPPPEQGAGAVRRAATSLVQWLTKRE